MSQALCTCLSKKVVLWTFLFVLVVGFLPQPTQAQTPADTSSDSVLRTLLEKVVAIEKEILSRLLSSRAVASVGVNANAEFTALAVASTEPTLTITLNPKEVLILDTEGECTTSDTIDLADQPITAFRRATNDVLLFTSNSTNIIVSGPTVNTAVRQDCKSNLVSTWNPNPNTYNGKEWLMAAYKTVSGEIIGFIHNEYHGEIVKVPTPEVCKRADGEPHKCWQGAVTAVRSLDGGKTFTDITADRRVFASTPYKYTNGLGRQGYSMPKVVGKPNDDYIYMFFLATDIPKIGTGAISYNGTCLARGLGTNGQNWRMWNGSSFSVEDIDPYKNTVTNPEKYLCIPVVAWNMMSIKYVPKEKMFLAVGYRGKDSVYAISSNLTDWSDPQLFNDPTLDADTAGAGEIWYLSLLDPTSSSVNFDTLEENPYLYYRRDKVSGSQVRSSEVLRRRMNLKFTY